MGLAKECSVCGSADRTQIETVTNVAPMKDEMLPVLLCASHKQMLAKGQLDILMNKQGDLEFIIKKTKK